MHQFGADLPRLFAIVAASSITFGAMIALTLALRPWRAAT
jgi:hypothetical protein